jgi:hypothetical protein
MAKMNSSEARRQDTREKIALGGLIIKAGLRHEKKAILLGALIELQGRLMADDTERERLRKIGAEAFGHDGD